MFVLFYTVDSQNTITYILRIGIMYIYRCECSNPDSSNNISSFSIIIIYGKNDITKWNHNHHSKAG